MEKKQPGRLATRHQQSQGVIGIVLEIIYGVFATLNPAKTAPISKKRG